MVDLIGYFTDRLKSMALGKIKQVSVEAIKGIIARLVENPEDAIEALRQFDIVTNQLVQSRSFGAVTVALDDFPVRSYVLDIDIREMDDRLSPYGLTWDSLTEDGLQGILRDAFGVSVISALAVAAVAVDPSFTAVEGTIRSLTTITDKPLLGVSFKAQNSVVIKATPLVGAILTLPSFTSTLWKDYEITTLMEQVVPLTGVTEERRPLLDGSGVVVAVMDTGIVEHKAITGRIVHHTDMTTGEESKAPKNPHSHGTHVAGIIISTDETYGGMAPGAKVVDVRVLDKDGRGSMSTILSGFKWIREHAAQYGIRIINMSLGGNIASCDGATKPCPMCREVNNMVIDLGITIVAAAGNEGVNYFSRYGAIGCPGKAKLSTTVGALDKNFKLATYSSIGRGGINKPDYVAIGGVHPSQAATSADKVVSSVPGDTFQGKSGTSMSTPVLVGLAALIFHRYPDYSRNDLIRFLDSSVDPSKITPRAESTGRGFVSADKVFSGLEAVLTPPVPVPVPGVPVPSIPIPTPTLGYVPAYVGF